MSDTVYVHIFLFKYLWPHETYTKYNTYIYIIKTAQKSRWFVAVALNFAFCRFHTTHMLSVFNQWTECCRKQEVSFHIFCSFVDALPFRHLNVYRIFIKSLLGTIQFLQFYVPCTLDMKRWRLRFSIQVT